MKAIVFFYVRKYNTSFQFLPQAFLITQQFGAEYYLLHLLKIDLGNKGSKNDWAEAKILNQIMSWLEQLAKRRGSCILIPLEKEGDSINF